MILASAPLRPRPPSPPPPPPSWGVRVTTPVAIRSRRVDSDRPIGPSGRDAHAVTRIGPGRPDGRNVIFGSGMIGRRPSGDRASAAGAALKVPIGAVAGTAGAADMGGGGGYLYPIRSLTRGVEVGASRKRAGGGGGGRALRRARATSAGRRRRREGDGGGFRPAQCWGLSARAAGGWADACAASLRLRERAGHAPPAARWRVWTRASGVREAAACRPEGAGRRRGPGRALAPHTTNRFTGKQ